jgi:hypothetical protein
LNDPDKTIFHAVQHIIHNSNIGTRAGIYLILTVKLSIFKTPLNKQKCSDVHFKSHY